MCSIRCSLFWRQQTAKYFLHSVLLFCLKVQKLHGTIRGRHEDMAWVCALWLFCWCFWDLNDFEFWKFYLMVVFVKLCPKILQAPQNLPTSPSKIKIRQVNSYFLNEGAKEKKLQPWKRDRGRSHPWPQWQLPSRNQQRPSLTIGMTSILKDCNIRNRHRLQYSALGLLLNCPRNWSLSQQPVGLSSDGLDFERLSSGCAWVTSEAQTQ